MWHRFKDLTDALTGNENNFRQNDDSIFDDNSDVSSIDGRGKMPLTFKWLFRKNKLAFIGIGVSIFLCVIFLVVISPVVLGAGNTKYVAKDDSLSCYSSADTSSSVVTSFAGCSEIDISDTDSEEWYYNTSNNCYVQSSFLLDDLSASCPVSGGVVSGIGSSYTSVSGSSKYWWPVGSKETTTVDGVVYATGAPLSTTITSSFGNQEEFRTSKHGGIDIGNGGNGPGVVNIIAVKDGVVTYPSDKSLTAFDDNGYYGNYEDGGGFGNYVAIRHNDGTVSVYAHLSQNTITVFAGDTVKQGQVIAKMGNSGSSTGTHLHFEIRVGGDRVYPLNYINPENTRP